MTYNGLGSAALTQLPSRSRRKVCFKFLYFFPLLCNIAHLKELCHEMNIFLKVYNNKKVFSVHALIVLQFLFLKKKSNTMF
jgi:hypothetical protein